MKIIVGIWGPYISWYMIMTDYDGYISIDKAWRPEGLGPSIFFLGFSQIFAAWTEQNKGAKVVERGTWFTLW
jgi:hypothetical protein